jgi:hypothetical protein
MEAAARCFERELCRLGKEGKVEDAARLSQPPAFLLLADQDLLDGVLNDAEGNSIFSHLAWTLRG